MSKVALLTVPLSFNKISTSGTDLLKKRLTGRFSCGTRSRGCSQLLRPIAWICDTSSTLFRRKHTLPRCNFPLRNGRFRTSRLPPMSSGRKKSVLNISFALYCARATVVKCAVFK